MDERLLNMSRRYWDKDDPLTEEQVHWVLRDEGYSKNEIDNAISDYWSIHIQSNILVHYWVAPIILTVVMVILVLYVQSLLK